MRWLAFGAGIIAAYVLIISWAVFWRGAFQVVYSPLPGWAIRTFARSAECVTVGARCYFYTSTDRPTPQRVAHERFHYENQWRKYPYTFLPRYFWELARVGYACAPMEETARAAGGEPTECLT